MNVSEFIQLINKPDAVQEQQTAALEKIVQEFPYFQSARAMYLKGLYNQNSFKYNYALKITAAHTTDRSVLFDFITSDTFTAIHKDLDQQQDAVNNASEIPVIREEIVLESRPNTVEQSIVASINEAAPADRVVSQIAEETTEAREPEPETPQIENILETVPLLTEADFIPAQPIAEKLEIGKPLDFAAGEKHSFQEWLQLSKFKPISREDEPQQSETPPADPQITDPDTSASEVNFEKQKKNELIDKFIETSPKIPQLKHDMPLPGTFYEPSKADNSFLMTETLARVYLEQKKYHKAIQAYEILILKYPEKSSFFADRILDIKNLQQNNT